MSGLTQTREGLASERIVELEHWATERRELSRRLDEQLDALRDAQTGAAQRADARAASLSARLDELERQAALRDDAVALDASRGDARLDGVVKQLAQLDASTIGALASQAKGEQRLAQVLLRTAHARPTPRGRACGAGAAVCAGDFAHPGARRGCDGGDREDED